MAIAKLEAAGKLFAGQGDLALFPGGELVQVLVQHADLQPLQHRADGVGLAAQVVVGGTDGAQLSFRGLPCPNIFAGGVNFHGPYEFVSIQVMEKAVSTIVKICELTAEYND